MDDLIEDVKLMQKALFDLELDWADKLCGKLLTALKTSQDDKARIERLEKVIERLGSGEAFTHSFMINKKSNEGAELDARMSYARAALGDKS